MFNEASYCLHGVCLNGEITVNSEKTVFLFLLCKLKLVIFMPILKLMKQNINIPLSVEHSIQTGGKR